MKKISFATGMVMAMVVLTAGLWTGCESAGNTDGVSLSPSGVTLGSGSTNGANAVVFTAVVHDPLALPLVWSVSNPSLGTIVSASGSNATYSANTGRTGNNIVTVQDQYDNKGSAVITQQ